MGIRNAAFGATFTGGVTVVTTAETNLVNLTGVNLPLDSALVMLFWWFTLTIGVGTTSVQALVRRGSTATGVAVTPGRSLTATAGNIAFFSGCITDSPGIVAEQQYSMSVIQNGATANGTANEGALIAMVL